MTTAIARQMTFCTHLVWRKFPTHGNGVVHKRRSIRVCMVTSSNTQMLMAALIGLIVVVVVIRLSRRRLLSFRYTIGWLMVASVGILAGLLIPLAEPVASALGLSAAALVALVALVFFTVISIQLSISISGLQQQVRTLTEDVARLRQQTDNSSPTSTNAGSPPAL